MKKCSARATRVASGVLEGDERREGEGREESPIPSQSRKNVRRDVWVDVWEMGSQLW